MAVSRNVIGYYFYSSWYQSLLNGAALPWGRYSGFVRGRSFPPPSTCQWTVVSVKEMEVCWFMGSVKLWEEEIGLLGSWVQMPDFMQSHLFPFFFSVQATSFSSFYNVWMGKDLGNPVVWSLLQKGKGLTQESPEDTEWVNGKTMIWSQVGVLVGLFNSPFHSSAFGSPSLRYMVRYLIKDTQSMFLHSCQNRSVYLTWDLHPYQKVNVSLVLGYVPVLPALGWQKQEAKVNGLLLLLCVAE